MNRSDATAQTAPGGRPQKPKADVLVVSYAGLIAADGGSLVYNIYHDSHFLHLPGALSVIGGILPPLLSCFLGHVSAASGFSKQGKAWIFFVTSCAMVISAISTAKVLEAGYTLYGGLLYSFMLDAAAMTFLLLIFRAYDRQAAYDKSLPQADPAASRAGEQAPETAPAPAPVLVPAMAAGNQAAPTAGSPEPALAAVPGTASEAPVPAAGSGNREPVPAAAPAGGPGNQDAEPRPQRERPVPVAPRPARAAIAQASAGQERESREYVVDEMAARPRAAVESIEHQQQRALGILAEFTRRTGVRMSNQELAKALGIRKAAVVGEEGLRRAIKDREDEQEKQERERAA